MDEGYEGSIIPIKLTLGDQVLSALRENTQLEWVFTTKSKAMKGVKSGKYYAAIVIPEDFSRNMMSVFTSDIQKPEITYYSNAKENAIAPKVTDKGATAIQTQVNEVLSRRSRTPYLPPCRPYQMRQTAKVPVRLSAT